MKHASGKPRQLPRLSVRREWSRYTERASLAMREPMLQQAHANYALIDKPGVKLTLAREIAMTRSAELTLAYHNLVMVASGLRRRRRARTDELTDEPCVIF